MFLLAWCFKCDGSRYLVSAGSFVVLVVLRLGQRGSFVGVVQCSVCGT